MKKCVYAGTFDPLTSGHKSVIEKCLKIFDKVVLAVMVNPQKEPFLTVDERVELLKKLFSDNENVKICALRALRLTFWKGKIRRFTCAACATEWTLITKTATVMQMKS